MSIRVYYEILNQKGTPAFLSDTYANRPSFGFQGRVFISTDTGQIFEDTGSAWTLIADAGVGGGTLASVCANGNTTATGLTVTANDISSNILNITGTSGNNGLISFNQNSSIPSGVTNKSTLFAYANLGFYLNVNTSGFNYGAYLNTALITANSPKNFYFPDANGSFALAQYGLSGYSTVPNLSAFSNSQFYSGLTNPSESHTYNIGVTGTALANSSVSTQWGVGVYGAGYTNGGTRSAGVQGDGEVTSSSDTGSAIGVRGYATATHSGGLNIGILGDASGSSTGNYGIYTNMASASNTFANYHLGTAISYFGGNVGILQSNPSYQLDVTGTGRFTGALNAASLTTASSNPYFLLNDTSGVTAGSIGFYSNNVQKFNLATQGTSFDLGLYNNGGTNSFNFYVKYSNGNVLINTTTDNGIKVQVAGDIFATGYLYFKNQASTNNFAIFGNNLIYVYNSAVGNIATINNATGVYTPISDVNRKKDFESSNIGLNSILGLKPTMYRMKEEDNTEKHLGFIAQEVKEFIPQAYIESGDFIGLDYQAIVSTLVKAVQELNEKLERNNIN